MTRNVMDLLKDYGSSSSSDDDDDDKEEKGSTECDVKLPALPASLLSMFSNKDEENYNNSELHKGKKRSFPHVPGNWATHVYCKVPVSDELSSLISSLVACFPSDIDVELMDDLHISLSRTVTLQYHWIQPFTDDLREQLGAKLSPFTCSLDGVKILTNDERSRSFLALTVSAGSRDLQSALRVVDKCLLEFSLPTFYEDACFHTSFAWFLGDEDLVTKEVNERLQTCFAEHQSSYPLLVDTIWCKSGCKQFSFKLTG